MAFKTYVQTHVKTGERSQRPFQPEHFADMGVPYTPAAGMPLLESYQIVNKWNATQAVPSYVYALPTHGLEARC